MIIKILCCKSEHIWKKVRFIEIGFKDFLNVLECAVRATLTEDAVIWYDDPIDTNKPAAIGSQKISEIGTTKGYPVTNGFIKRKPENSGFRY